MRTKKNGSSSGSHGRRPPVVSPEHAFTPEYLAVMNGRDEPVTGGEADAVGPWHIEEHPQGWAVLRLGESLAYGSRPMAVFQKIDAARLACAVLPGCGRRLRYRLGQDPEGELGFPVFDDGQVAGWLQLFHQDFLDALNVADALVSIPGDLAWVIEGAGFLACDHAGKIAAERMRETIGHPEEDGGDGGA